MNHGAKVVEAVEPDLDCTGCGYDLRGIASERCPECGRWFDRTGRLTSRLPRARRGWGLGWVRNYLWTAWRVSRRPSWLAGEIERVVEAGAARRFRWVTVIVAWLTFSAVTYWARFIYFFGERPSKNPDWAERFFTQSAADHVGGLLIWRWSYWVSVLAALAFFACATAVAGWFVHSRRADDVRANRAASLALYTCAPLAWTPVVAVGCGIAYVGLDWLKLWRRWGEWQWWTYEAVLPALLVLVWARSVVVLVRATTGCGWARAAGAAVLLPVIWAGMAVLIFGAAHGLSAFVLLLLRSWS